LVVSTADRKLKVVFVKGAPEKVAALCEPPKDSSGSSSSPKHGTSFWLNHASTAAAKGMRVLGLAFKIVPDDFEFSGHLAPCSGFTMSALVGIMDPPRPDAIVAIKQAHLAGICVKMITGDHPVTALAIGKMLGLSASNNSSEDVESRGNDQALTGADLDRMENDEQFDEMVVNNNIFARTTPEHKLRIVKSLQRQGFVCSMTGDGVNDAPALKAANIGVAMGITGTEVAKDAANMILTDDNFATIVDAIRVGRCTYNNLIKIITFVLPTNGGQAISILGALVIGVEVPITALQILWVNMLTSASLGMVLAFDKPGTDILSDKPRHLKKRIFGRFLRWRLVFVTLVLVVAVLGMYHWERERISSVDELRTIAVNTLSFAQIGYLFNCRSLRRNVPFAELFGGNQIIYIAIFVVVVLQVLFTYAPPLQWVFNTRAIDGISWGKMMLVSVCVFIIVECEKYVSIKRHEYLKKRREAKV
jgi:magnesium-transporting ATPase (P-type)